MSSRWIFNLWMSATAIGGESLSHKLIRMYSIAGKYRHTGQRDGDEIMVWLKSKQLT